jgi:hypothetical protein
MWSLPESQVIHRQCSRKAEGNDRWARSASIACLAVATRRTYDAVTASVALNRHVHAPLRQRPCSLWRLAASYVTGAPL